MEPSFELNVFEVEVTPELTTVEISSTGLQGPVGPEGPAGADGGGVPNGGSTGDVLIKNSPADQDVGWGSVVSSANVEFPIDPELLYENALI